MYDIINILFQFYILYVSLYLNLKKNLTQTKNKRVKKNITSYIVFLFY